MNSIIQLCPKCNKHTNIVLDKDNVIISCCCGFCSTMNVKSVISELNQNNLNMPNTDDTFSEMKTDINKGYQHLSTYFWKVKDDYINNMLSQINTI